MNLILSLPRSNTSLIMQLMVVMQLVFVSRVSQKWQQLLSGELCWKQGIPVMKQTKWPTSMSPPFFYAYFVITTFNSQIKVSRRELGDYVQNHSSVSRDHDLASFTAWHLSEGVSRGACFFFARSKSSWTFPDKQGCRWQPWRWLWRPQKGYHRLSTPRHYCSTRATHSPESKGRTWMGSPSDGQTSLSFGVSLEWPVSTVNYGQDDSHYFFLEHRPILQWESRCLALRSSHDISFLMIKSTLQL